MKILELKPQHLTLAIIIGLCISGCITYVTAPHPVATPVQMITPVPTPPPVSIQPEVTIRYSGYGGSGGEGYVVYVGGGGGKSNLYGGAPTTEPTALPTPDQSSDGLVSFFIGLVIAFALVMSVIGIFSVIYDSVRDLEEY